MFLDTHLHHKLKDGLYPDEPQGPATRDVTEAILSSWIPPLDDIQGPFDYHCGCGDSVKSATVTVIDLDLKSRTDE